ncbi:MAG: YitT family protein [Anaerolineae bacterium]|nr:YitT family protein [Anaerolineae bacterium]
MSANPRFASAVRVGWQIVLLTLGAVISAIAVIVFQAPFDIAPGGISGIAIILNSLIGSPIGLVILLGNIPIQLFAYRMLGGWRVVAATVFAVVLYSLLIDFLTPYFSIVSDDRFLNAVFGGIIGGIGTGLVLRGGGTMGGTSTLGRILLRRYGIPLSSSTLYTDGAVVLLAGLVFGWEATLYAMVALFVGGATADYVLEGPSVVRTAVIITDHPHEVSDRILLDLHRGVTAWEAKGMFTEQPHTVLYVTIGRSEVNRVRRIVRMVDPNAFLVIGQGHAAYGEGFRELRRE